MHSLATALTLTLTLSLNHLANKQLRSSHTLYSLINGSAMDLRTAPCVDRHNLLRHVTSVYSSDLCEPKRKKILTGRVLHCLSSSHNRPFRFTFCGMQLPASCPVS